MTGDPKVENYSYHPFQSHTYTYGPLSRDEKILIISSVLQGVGTKPHFDDDLLKNRIAQCLQIAEEMICLNPFKVAELAESTI